jgi:hypothetical protein
MCLAASVALGILCGNGCSNTPAPPPRQKLDPQAAAKAAMAAYDADHNGVLDAKELEKSPPLQVALKNMGGDAAGGLKEAAIAARMSNWLKSSAIIMNLPISVTLDGSPLDGATVTFDPEPFLGSGYTACSGVTDKAGTVYLKGPLEKFSGIYVGLYRVRISKKLNGQETIPARYNTETTLGYEMAGDMKRATAMPAFDLQSQ